MEDLVESILDYVRSEYTDYAIMINGEWGSGKTYFWNNKIRNRIDSLNVNGKKFSTIYMSLYGISNLDDISKKIFIEMNPALNRSVKKILDSRHMSYIPEYVKTGMDMANSFGFMQTNEKVDYAKFFDVDDKKVLLGLFESMKESVTPKPWAKYLFFIESFSFFSSLDFPLVIIDTSTLITIR